MKQLYRIEIFGRSGSGKTTRAMQIFNRRKELNLGTTVIDDGYCVADCTGKAERLHVTVETREADCDLTEIRFTEEPNNTNPLARGLFYERKKQMKELHVIKVSGPVGCGKTTKAWEIFEERKAAGLSTILIDDGNVRDRYEGSDTDCVVIETVEEGHELTVTEVQ